MRPAELPEVLGDIATTWPGLPRCSAGTETRSVSTGTSIEI